MDIIKWMIIALVGMKRTGPRGVSFIQKLSKLPEILIPQKNQKKMKWNEISLRDWFGFFPASHLEV